MTEHTALPLRIVPTESGIHHILDAKGNTLASVMGEANARFIVTACNCHAEMLEALKKLVNATILGTGAFALTQAEQAIRKAEEQIR